MSPPCVAAIFEGDNGGGTGRGVTGTEIRVGMPVSSITPSVVGPIDALFEHVNQSFELYGRRLVPVYVPGGVASALTARAKAADMAAQGIFAAVTGPNEWNLAQPALPASLARDGIVTIVRGGAWWASDRTLYDPLHPYVWGVYPSAEDLQTNLADFACTSLMGHPAIHAGDPNLRSEDRRFAIIASGYEVTPAASVLASALDACSDGAPLRLDWAYSSGTATLRSGLERLRSDGATTLICVCETPQLVLPEAQTIGFHPEWVLTPGYLASGNDEHWLQPLRASNSVAPPLRVGSGPRALPLQARPWFAALQGRVTLDYTALGTTEFTYPGLLVLASGIQGAGPDLTPETFAAALLATTFPNAGAGKAPYYQPSAGFGPGDHSFYDDYIVGWWSDTADAVDIGVGVSANLKGSWCYLDQATRFRPGTYPADADQRLFNPAVPCR